MHAVLICAYYFACFAVCAPGRWCSTRLASEFSLSMKTLSVTGDDAYYANFVTPEFVLAVRVCARVCMCVCVCL